MQQAREALMFGLERLRVADRFNIIAFSRQGSPVVYGQPRSADDASKDAARSFVACRWKRMAAPRLAGARSSVERRRKREAAISQIVLLTDGAVGNGLSC